jgi:16S rRNA (guanine966-N2)-methyltransferase
MCASMAPNKVRINAGKYRGRQIVFQSDRVRPTKSIVRKTLMNWLRPLIAGRRCLDCFAGSGILAFDALSEGARSVLCYDSSSQVIADIRKNQERLAVENLVCVQERFPYTLGSGELFDLVFLDPPFYEIPMQTCLAWLLAQRCLAPGALVYVEGPRALEEDFPEAFSVCKRGSSAGVAFYLLAYEAWEKNLEDGSES